MRILITGANGQLGHELRQVLQRHEVIPCVWPDFDLLKPDVEPRIVTARPDVVIHAAAYTNVDQAEREPDLAMAVNGEGTEKVARAADKVAARLFYLSTDYVFDGQKRAPYRETDQPNPLNSYGRSKLEGERRALHFCSNTLVVRTSWLYGSQGQNFVKTIMRLAAEQPVLRVVADQHGCPTHAGDLAKALEGLLATNLKGVIHATGGGECSWYQFACEIVALLGASLRMEPITSADYPRPALRPPYSVLSNHILNQAGLMMPHWREALARFMSEVRSIAPARV